MAFHSEDGTRLCVNLPFTVFRLGAMYDLISFSFHTEEGAQDAEQIARAMAGVDFKQVARLIENGATGTLVDVNFGDRLTIWVE